MLILLTGSPCGTSSATSAWPDSWYATVFRSCSFITRLFFSEPAITRSIAASKSFNVTAAALCRAARGAARDKGAAVTLNDFEAAIERVIAGSEKKSRVMNEQERTRVAYHESGHALVAELVPHREPVTKISIVPHSRGALGYTIQTPTEDRYLLA